MDLKYDSTYKNVEIYILKEKVKKDKFTDFTHSC